MNRDEITKQFRNKRLKLNSLLKNYDRKKELNIIAKAATLAGKCGFFSSRKIEDRLIAVAKKHSISLTKNYAENSFLHVFTQCYLTGGHTRVCERWIKYSPSSQKHSIYLINQEQNPIPQLLFDVVAEKEGVVFINREKDFINTALHLRQTAAAYEKIILHVHMDDIVPIIAFGTEEFSRPIIFFNHADHCFWLGVSIADLVANLRTSAKDFDIKYRGTTNNFVLPLPIDQPTSLYKNQEEIKKTREELGINPDKKVILSMASSYKYTPFDAYDFVKTAKIILSKRPDITFLIIGPTQNEKYWQEAKLSSEGRIKAIGTIPYDKIEKYLKIADIAFDSIPLGSFTSLLDIAKYNIHCLSLVSPINQIDSFISGKIICQTQEEMAERALLILNKKEENHLYKILQQQHFPESFANNLNKLYQHLPLHHSINLFNSDENNDELHESEIFMTKLKMAEKLNNSHYNKNKFMTKISNIYRALIRIFSCN